MMYNDNKVILFCPKEGVMHNNRLLTCLFSLTAPCRLQQVLRPLRPRWWDPDMAAAQGHSAAPSAAPSSSWLWEALASGFLSCPICLERFSRPKILPCLHTYCQGCLETLLDGRAEEEAEEAAEEEADAQTLRCPECRVRVPLPAGGVAALKTNFFINGLLDLACPAGRAPSSPACALCPLIGQEPPRPASSHCLDCADDMCPSCAGGHRCSRLTHNHRVVDMEGYLSGRYDREVRERQASRCKKHSGEELRFFCDRCAAPLCRECRLGPHLQHPCRTLAEAAEERRLAVEELLGKVEAVARRLATDRAGLEAAVEGLEAGQARIRTRVEEACSRAVAWLLSQREEVLARLSEHVEERRKAWAALRSELELQEQVASSTAAFARRVLTQGQGVEVLSLEQLVSERLKELQEGHSDETLQIRLPRLEIDLADLEGGRSPFRLEEEGEEEEEEEELSRAEKKRRKKKTKKQQQQQEPQTGGEAPKAPSPEKPSSQEVLPAAPSRAAPKAFFSCSFWAKTPTDKRRPQVTGLCPFGPGELLVADETNGQLKRFSLQGEFRGTVPVPEGVAPFSVAALGSKVAFTAGSRLFLLDGHGGLAWEKALPKGQANHAMAALGSDRLAVSVTGHVELYNLEGQQVGKVRPGGSARHCLVFLARREGGFVGSDWHYNSVVLFAENGGLVAECQERQLGGCQPGSVCTDPRGTVYVVLRELNRVLALSPAGEVLGDFLTAENGIDRPRMATVAGDGRLAVALCNGTIHVFKIRY
ncbi:E3 ubiquitin-protein ligase TRIM56-like [Anolis carolinensis]|uniref:E3 ubiquitin-protein ligase TRIM56-like n=1 Tax=Anolis carolinensis TaxID=28377 RepID=UPI002F2B7720